MTVRSISAFARPRLTASRFARLLARTAVLGAAGTVPWFAQAAVLTVTIQNSAGKPLTDAVALLSPTHGKAAVKPMGDVEIAQAKRQFQPRVTLITVGTRATFPNFDTVRHQVYSFSAIKPFELKLYAGIPNFALTFDKPGIAVLGCNIHDTMAAWVVVSDTPWFGRSGADGRVRIDGAPAGSYKLLVWHPDLPPNSDPVPVPVTLTAADAEVRTQLTVVEP